MAKIFSSDDRTKRFAPIGILFALLGLALFVYFVRKAGISEIANGIRRLGVAFLLILALSGMRHMVRSIAWIKCFEPPYGLRFRDALAARLMGDALGNIIPFISVAVSEPSKAAFVKHRVPLITGLSALAIENIFYSFSVMLVIFSGMSALLLNFPLPKPLRYSSIGALVVIVVLSLVFLTAIARQWRIVSGPLRYLSRRRPKPVWLTQRIPRLEAFESQIYGFYGRNRSRLFTIFALDLCFHLAGVAEVYTALFFIADSMQPTLLTAFILESVNRIINVVFKFIPLRTGVDEAGTGLLAKILGFTTVVGVALAIVRKGRDIFWTAIGVALILRRGFSVRALATEPEKVIAEA